jgi:hypothetical protein
MHTSSVGFIIMLRRAAHDDDDAERMRLARYAYANRIDVSWL